jgi:type IX secretion system substrate protein
MKIKFTLTLFTLLLTALLFINNASGPGNIQDKDRTGSPLSPGSCSAPGCHSGGGFNPSVSIELLKNNQPVTTYIPGVTYDVKVTITASQGTPAGYGFQAVALAGVDNDNTGTWSSPTPGIQSLTLSNGRTYVEHSTPNTTNNFFQTEWMAPDIETGDVTFYAAGNAINLNNSTTGDIATTAQLVISEIGTSSVIDQQNLLNFTIFPNPVDDILNFKISSRSSGDFDLQIISTDGRIVQKQSIDLTEGENEKSINVSNLSNGIYLIQLVHDKEAATQTILKM